MEALTATQVKAELLKRSNEMTTALSQCLVELIFNEKFSEVLITNERRRRK